MPCRPLWVRPKLGGMMDAPFRLAYRLAYQVMRIYWAVRRPRTHGALVAIWVDQRILLIRNSYVSYYSLPGGYVKSGETGLDAAVRELREEIGLIVPSSDLRPSVDEHHDWHGKREWLQIYELHVEQEPKVKVDNREVVSAAFYTPIEALKLELYPPLRKHIEQKMQPQ